MTDLTLQDRQWEIVGSLLGLAELRASDLDAMRLVLNRFSPEVIARLGRASIDFGILHRVIPRRTLEHRRQRQEPLTQEESERAYRVASILALAETVLDDRQPATSWLAAPNGAWAKRPHRLARYRVPRASGGRTTLQNI